MDPLIARMRAIAEEAGHRLLSAFSLQARPGSREQVLQAMAVNERLVTQDLKTSLTALQPAAAWWDDEEGGEAMPDGEWWLVDTVEGNVNHVHGSGEWGVTITLVRDRQPVAAVVHQPVEAVTWTAVREGGTRRNGQPVHIGAKARLDAAIATTGQAEAGQTHTYAVIGRSVSAMLGQALLVRMAVPTTFQLLQLAEGRSDVFWQYEPSWTGIAAGLLMVTEAGGVASRLDGTPWQPGAGDILLTTPTLHAAAVATLRGVAIAEAA
ncbi:MAG: inositol monophosphatase family protein [Burkholderiaceae bacterium]